MTVTDITSPGDDELDPVDPVTIVAQTTNIDPCASCVHVRDDHNDEDGCVAGWRSGTCRCTKFVDARVAVDG